MADRFAGGADHGRAREVETDWRTRGLRQRPRERDERNALGGAAPAALPAPRQDHMGRGGRRDMFRAFIAQCWQIDPREQMLAGAEPRADNARALFGGARGEI